MHKNGTNSAKVNWLSKIFNRNSAARREKAESLTSKGDHLVFTGGSKYDSISLTSIKSISYNPREEYWQEVRIEIEKQGAFNYYFNTDSQSLEKAIEDINQVLEPSQPICKFILSAKQGLLSGKD